MPLPPNTRLGRYEIRSQIGAGGMGEVYLAEDTGLRRKVAIKVLPESLAQDKARLRRFEQEAFAASALNHPNILTIHEFGAEGGTHFIASEYVDGATLRARLLHAPFTLGEALDVAIQIAQALAAAHEAKIIHRDIKPENIIVRRDGYVKVLDFGLAKLGEHVPSAASAGSEHPTKPLLRTEAGKVIGTAPYMSPEQARGIPLDARTDIWSLGVVIYEILTGHMPFSGETRTDVIVSVLSREPLPISSYGRDVPPELVRVVSKALSKEVAGRYQTATELRLDLEKIKKQLEFGESVNSSAGHNREEKERAPFTAATAHPTANDANVRTGGALDGAAGTRNARPSPGLAGYLRPAQSRGAVYPALALALLAVVSAVAYFVLATSVDNRRIDSIAVLPFENLSGNPGLTFVSDGLSEALIDRLSQLPQLKVISRHSSFAFRGANIDLRDVAAKLGVRAIVTGNVAQVGDELVVRLDVVDAVENRHLTGVRFRRRPSDLLSVQSEIAQKATEQLQVKLTDAQSKRLSENGTENSEAYRFYLSGLVELNGPQDVRGRALEYFERAVALDPDFAAAHSEIAWVHWSRANGSSDPQALMPKAKAATERALAIDPDLAKAHVLKALLSEYEFDWQGAEGEYRRAIELSPNLGFARNNYAFYLSVMGRQEDALAELEQQRIRDPINQRLALLQKGIILTQAKRFDEALQTYQEAQAVEPEREIPYFSLGYAYAGKGLYNEAAAYYKKSISLLGGEEKYSQPLVYLAAAYARMPEKRGEARAILRRIEAMSDYSSPALLAAAYSALDDKDKAMVLLERSYIERDPLLRFIGTGYEYDGLRADPRFAGLTRRVGLSR
ncbi:MAG TPA: protein kinase [Pyrinomonadaceae bacterium]|nr:protein kinase [Pyrinomonadaceae bacterium]